MDRFEERLRDLGVLLPAIPTPIANYVPAKKVGNLVFTAGQVSSENGHDYKGKLGDDLSLDEVRAATRASAIAAVKALVGTLGRVRQIVAVHGLINSTLDCGDQAAAMNGASDFVVDVFG